MRRVKEQGTKNLQDGEDDVKCLLTWYHEILPQIKQDTKNSPYYNLILIRIENNYRHSYILSVCWWKVYICMSLGKMYS